MVIGIEPGGTRTRSATLNPCDVEIAAVTSPLTVSSFFHYIPIGVAAILKFDDYDKLLDALIRNRYRRAPPWVIS